jgi:F0F1-type ATP synthase membrane subunit b/b'
MLSGVQEFADHVVHRALTVMVAVVREDMAQARQEVMKELIQTTSRLATDLAGKIVGKSLDAADHRRLIDESVDQIVRRASEER